MINIQHVLFFSLALFSIGMLGVIMRRNLVFILLSLELMLNAVGVLFVSASSVHANADGQIMYLLVLALAAAEVALALGLVLHMYRRIRTLDVDQLSTMGDANV
jgi:NADH-quinone oxidoreductase subunit K